MRFVPNYNQTAKVCWKCVKLNYNGDGVWDAFGFCHVMMLKYFCDLSVTILTEMMIHCLNYNRKLEKNVIFSNFRKITKFQDFKSFSEFSIKFLETPNFFRSNDYVQLSYLFILSLIDAMSAYVGRGEVSAKLYFLENHKTRGL